MVFGGGTQRSIVCATFTLLVLRARARILADHLIATLTIHLRHVRVHTDFEQLISPMRLFAGPLRYVLL